MTRSRHHRAVGPERAIGPVAVAPARQREARRLVGVLQHRIAARHVAVERGIADRHLALVAGGQQHVAEAVAERHQRHHPQPRLDIFLGEAGLVAGEARREHLVERVDAGRDRDDVMAAAEQPRAFFGVLEAFVAGIFRRQHHAPDPVGAQRIDRDRGGQRAVDPARQAEDDAGKAVAVDIIAQGDHHRAVDVLRIADRARGCGRSCSASRRACATHSVISKRFVPVGQLGAQLELAAVARLHDEGRAVERQFVLPADAVEIGERQAGVRRPGFSPAPAAASSLLSS